MDKNGIRYINSYTNLDPIRKDLFSVEFLPRKYMMNESTLNLINSRIATCDFSIIYTPPGFNITTSEENLIKMHFIEKEDMGVFNYFEKIASKRIFNFKYIFYNSCGLPIRECLFEKCSVRGIEVTGEEVMELIVRIIFNNYKMKFC